MDFKLIDGLTLRVTLSERELRGYSLSCESIDYSNTETRRALWDIFDRAKRETGFDAAASRIYIQVYPDSDGGCEIYAAGIDGEYAPEAGIYKSGPVRSAVFRFSEKKELIRACRALMSCSYRPRGSRLFRGADGYFLELLPENGERSAWLMCEYGEPEDAEFFALCSGERFELLMEEDAVERLAGKLL